MKAFGLEELQRGHGSSSQRILVSILSDIYDVSTGAEFFGPSGPYRVYAGHDATYCLATMSLKPADLDRFQYILDDDDLQCLADWVAYFRVKYGPAVGRITGVKHPLSLADLPTGKDPTKLIAQGHPAVDGTAQEKAAFNSEVKQASEDTTTKGEKLPLSKWLITKTNDLHEQALRCEFMQHMMQRRVQRHDYAAFVAALYYVYTELEHQLEEHAQEPLIQAIDDPRLRRLGNLEEDLAFFYGAHWATVMPSPSLWTIRYVARISDIATKPHRLVVHHWMRYGGGLAGGQFLKAALKAGLRLKPQQEQTAVPGVRYHQFDALAEGIQPAYESYLAALDTLELSDHQRQEMLEEARYAFQLNLHLNEELAERSRASRADAPPPTLPALADRPTFYSSL